MLTIVSPLFGVVSDRLGSLIQNEVDMKLGIRKEMAELFNTIRSIQFVLEDAEEKQVQNKRISDWLNKLKDTAYEADDLLNQLVLKDAEKKQVQNKSTSDWLNQLKDAAYEADDLLDELIVATQSKSETKKKVWFSFIPEFKVRMKMSKQFLKLGVRFEEIASKLELNWKDKHHQNQQQILSNFSNSKPPILGRELDKENIVRLLVTPNLQDDLLICPIVGMGGIGKTTLAQLVYNDDRVVNYFDVRIWVVVSQDYDLKMITREAISLVTKKECTIQELDLLQSRLHEILAAKRFLLVLDDVWSEDLEEWEKFEFAFRCGAKGSSVLITTRFQTVASITGTCPAYSLSSLSDDDCWSLVKHGSFGMGNEENANLVGIGKEIVRKCRGVPLAAKLLAGLLRSKVEVTAWLGVRDNSVWDIGEVGILPSMRLSYVHLSPQMKLCFSYCAIFPSKYRFLSEDIIRLWMANGFLQPREELQLEEVGYEILTSLIYRSFFQDAEYDEEGKAVSFMMHDLVHELAIFVSADEQFFVSEDWRKTRSSKGKKQFLLKGPRHLLVDLKTTSSSSSSSVVQSIQQSAPNLRTCILSSPLKSEILFRLDFLSFKSLRVMSMDSIGVSRLPDSLGSLSHLRYLELSHSEFTSLPETISALKNLQTLKLENCFFLEKLPKCTKNMSSLRHLDIRGCSRLREMPIGVGQLVCLQTLSIFVVGSVVGRHISELQGLDKLTGELMLKGLEHVRSLEDAKEANLIKKESLRALHLIWSDSHLQEENDRDVIEGLQPTHNLRRLVTEGYQGRTFPRWLDVSLLPNLVEIHFWRCTSCEHLPPLGSLPLLRVLHVISMHSLKFVNRNEMVDSYPSLKELELGDMPKLEEWTSSVGKCGGEQQVIMLPALRRLRTSDCPKLKRLPLSSYLEVLQLSACNNMVLESLKDLPRLVSLEITGFKEIVPFSERMLQNLIELQSLVIDGCPDVESLPKQLEHISTLEYLYLRELSSLISLPPWIGSLKNLRHMHIYSCKNLTALPDGLKYLTSLRIRNCNPELHRRCRKGVGEDWHKIAHIQDLQISED